MAIDPEPLDLARDRLEVDRTEQGNQLETSSIEPNRALTLKHRTDPSRRVCSDRLDRLPSLSMRRGYETAN